MLKMIDLKHLKNLCFTIFLKKVIKFEAPPNRFLIDAGLGDTILYLNQLQKYVRYFGKPVTVFVPGNYIPTLASFKMSKLLLEAISSSAETIQHINISPQSRITHVSKITKLQATRYAMRAIKRKFFLFSTTNEYLISEAFLRDLFSVLSLETILSNEEVKQIIICPDTSSQYKSLSVLELSKFVSLIKKKRPNISVKIITSRKDGVPRGVTTEFQTSFGDYRSASGDLILCADTALLHFFSLKNQRVVLLQKDKQFLSFDANVPIVNIFEITRSLTVVQ